LISGQLRWHSARPASFLPDEKEKSDFARRTRPGTPLASGGWGCRLRGRHFRKAAPSPGSWAIARLWLFPYCGRARRSASSSSVEETAYWLNLLIDTTIPICGNSAQRTHGEISNDGPKNLTDSVEYITSRVWADEQGRNRAGVIVLQEQQIFAAREVMKVDARPGGYVATGGHGGIIGGMGYHGAAVLHYVPVLKHTYLSEVNLSKIPSSVLVAGTPNGRIERTETKIRDAEGDLFEGAIPSVTIIKDGGYYAEEYFDGPSVTEDLEAHIARKLREKFVRWKSKKIAKKIAKNKRCYANNLTTPLKER